MTTPSEGVEWEGVVEIAAVAGNLGNVAVWRRLVRCFCGKVWAISLLEVVKDKMKFRKGNWMGLEGFQEEFAKILGGFLRV